MAGRFLGAEICVKIKSAKKIFIFLYLVTGKCIIRNLGIQKMKITQIDCHLVEG